MITADGFSKDQSIPPEGVVVTFGKDMMQEQGGAKKFLSEFLYSMESYELGNYWMHKCSNLPTRELDIVYIIVMNRLWGKAYCGGYKKYNGEETTGYSADGRTKIIDWSYITLSGPFERCPFKRTLQGFQGFRYCTKLF